MIIAGVVLLASGVFATTYRVVHPPPIEIPSYYTYPYATVGIVLGILGLVMLIIGPLLLLVKLEK